MSEVQNRTWPPAAGICTPTIPSPSDVIFPLHSSVTVNAPATIIWEVLLDTSTYPEWNSFCSKVVINSQPDGSNSAVLQKGTAMTFDAVMNPAKPQSANPTSLKVYDVSTPDAHSDYITEPMLSQGSFTKDLDRIYRISWRLEGGFAARGLKSERVHEIIILSDNQCEVRSWETLSGVLARAVKWTYGTALPERFQAWADDLKMQSEKVASARANL